MVVLVGATLGGCARVQAALAVQPDDTVTGEVVIATPDTGTDDQGPALNIPPELADDVEVTPYRQDGYTGSLLRFDDLTFTEVSDLAVALRGPENSTALALRRAGNRVLLEGTVDLTGLPTDRADFQFKAGFPGEIIDSNGTTDPGEASWTFTAGEVDQVTTVVAYDDPGAPSLLNWTLMLAGVVALAAITVALLARRTRNPPVRRTAP